MHLEARIGTKLSHGLLAIRISKCILHSRQYILTAYFTHILLRKIIARFTLFQTNGSLIDLHATIQSRLNRYLQISLSQFILSEIERLEAIYISNCFKLLSRQLEGQRCNDLKLILYRLQALLQDIASKKDLKR